MSAPVLTSIAEVGNFFLQCLVTFFSTVPNIYNQIGLTLYITSKEMLFFQSIKKPHVDYKCCADILEFGMNRNISSRGLSVFELSVRYHDEGSKKLNARILLLAHMVYL
jgi:hypothetical protein